MKRREFIAILGSVATASPFATHAQHSLSKNPRVAYAALAPVDHLVQAFLKGLEDLGYVDGRNIRIDFKFAQGPVVTLDELVATTVNSAPDLIVVVGIAVLLPMSRATRLIPIVLAPGLSPVEFGLAASLAHPGGNVTGVSLYVAELNQKRIELLKEALPGVRSIAVVVNANNPRSVESWRESQAAGIQLGLEMHQTRSNGLSTLDADFAAIKEAHVEAIAVTSDAEFDVGRAQIVDLAAKYAFPAIYEHRAFIQSGGLMSYGPNIDAMSYRAASYLDKILNGTNPGVIPIEQPEKFELVVNRKVAKALGLTIPTSVLARADEVIE